jgi:hypothetical protein
VTSRREQFVDVSAELTGFPRAQLFGTGMSGTYLEVLDEILSVGGVDEFLALCTRPADSSGNAGVSGIVEDAGWGPVARNIIILWYCGTWTALPDAWRAVRGTAPTDTDHVVSAEAYQMGLQWVAAGAHPAGARQQGYGAWAIAPEEAVS